MRYGAIKDKSREYQQYVSEFTISTFFGQNKYILLMDQVSDHIDLNKLGLREASECGNLVIASNDKISYQFHDDA